MADNYNIDIGIGVNLKDSIDNTKLLSLSIQELAEEQQKAEEQFTALIDARAKLSRKAKEADQESYNQSADALRKYIAEIDKLIAEKSKIDTTVKMKTEVPFDEAAFNAQTNAFRNIENEAKKASENIEQLGAKTNTAAQNVEKSGSYFDSFGNRLKAAFQFDMVYQGINLIEQGLKKTIGFIVDTSVEFERLKATMAGQMAANIQFSENGIVAKNSVENMNIAIKESSIIFNKLRDAAAATGVPVTALAEAFGQTVGPLTKAGLSMDQAAKFTSTFSAVAKGMGVPISRIGVEIRDLSIGQASLMARTLGVTKATIEHHKAAGDLADYLMTLAERYQPLVDAQSQTASAIRGKMINALQDMADKASSGIFDVVKKDLTNLTTQMKSSASTIGSSMSNAFKTLYGAVKDVGSVVVTLSNHIPELAIAFTLLNLRNIALLFANVALKATDLVEAIYAMRTASLAFMATPIGAVLTALAVGAYGASKGFEALRNSFAPTAEEAKKMMKASDDAVKTNKIKALIDEQNKLKNIIAGQESAMNKVSGVAKKDFEISIEHSKARIAAIDEEIKKVNDLHAAKAKTNDPKITGTSKNNEEEKTTKPKGMEDQMQIWEEALNKKKIAHELSTEEEKQYWQTILSKAKEGTTEYGQVIAKIAGLTQKQRDDAKSAADEKTRDELGSLKTQIAEAQKGSQDKIDLTNAEVSFAKNAYGVESSQYRSALKDQTEAKKEQTLAILELDKQRILQQSSLALQGISNEESIEKQKLAFGLVTAAQDLKFKQDIENKKYQIEKESLQQELALSGLTVKEKEAVNKKIEALELKHTKAMSDLSLSLSKENAQIWLKMADAMQSGMQRGLAGVIKGTTSIRNAFKEMAKGMLDSVINSVTSMIAQYAMMFLKKKAMMLIDKAITMASNASNVASTTAATTATIAEGKVQAAAQIPALTEIAAMGAYASQAAIPIVGPELALAAYGVAESVGMASLATASASGGFDIGYGVNPITQLHQEEMVLPAHIANPLRDMISDGGASGGGSANHFHIHTMDAKGVKDFFLKNQDHLATALKSAQRNFKK